MRPCDLDQKLSDSLEALRRAGLHRRLRSIQSREGATILLEGRTVVDCASNDYLGLAANPRLREAVRDFVEAREIGTGAARLISGNRMEHGALEAELAAFKQTEDALLFGSGYLANLGTIAALVDQGDGIYADALNHASLIDGCRLSRGQVEVYHHRDLQDLEQRLAHGGQRYRRRWIVTDSVFSMDGDLAPLPDLMDLAEKYEAWVYVDDAHATGVLGASGRGSAEHWKLARPPHVTMGTLGKALGVSGAFVAGSTTVIEFLRQRARTFVYTTGTPAMLAVAARSALHLLQTDPSLLGRLRANVRTLRRGLEDRGLSVGGDPSTPILPVVLGSPERVTTVGEKLLDQGFLVGVVRPPTVPQGTSRLRVTVSALHDPGRLEALAEALAETLMAVPIR